MADREHFWRLEHLSDRQLLERLQGVLRTQRCALAELIAHLGEVEERRLHLVAAHGSMFSYCVQHLGMSEDEACRRIELARLARKFPVLFGELASGRISLSVALLLKPVLTPGNHAELIAAARGASMRTARELLAARLPKPDVPSRIRKLPERLVAHVIPATADEGIGGMPAPDVASAMAAAAAADVSTISAGTANAANRTQAAGAGVVSAISVPATDVAPARVTPDAIAAATAAPALISSLQRPRPLELEPDSLAARDAERLLQAPPAPTEPSPARPQAGLPRYADSRQRTDRQRIDPLSAERYRIQFTADASLKQKLELARDLLRHSNPNGDFAPVISRALDLLVEELMQRRFGARRKDTSRGSARPTSDAAPAAPAIETGAPATPPVTLPAPARPVAAAFVTAPPVAAPSAATRRPVTIPAPARPVAAAFVTAPPVAARSPTTTPLATTSLRPASDRRLPASSHEHRSAPVASALAATPLATTPVPPAAPVASPLAPARAAPLGVTPTSYLRRAVRRAVLERDGLGCCWADAEGNRCGSTAWLELDHRHPSGKGGGSQPENLRLLCRAHNRFAAEHTYGRDHVERAIQTRQRSSKRRAPNGQPPSSSPAPA